MNQEAKSMEMIIDIMHPPTIYRRKKTVTMGRMITHAKHNSKHESILTCAHNDSNGMDEVSFRENDWIE